METMISIDLIKQDAFGSLCKQLELFMVVFCTIRLLGKLVVSVVKIN